MIDNQESETDLEFPRLNRRFQFIPDLDSRLIIFTCSLLHTQIYIGLCSNRILDMLMLIVFCITRIINHLLFVKGFAKWKFSRLLRNSASRLTPLGWIILIGLLRASGVLRLSYTGVTSQRYKGSFDSLNVILMYSLISNIPLCTEWKVTGKLSNINFPLFL